MHMAVNSDFRNVPSGFGDDHLGAQLVEFGPELLRNGLEIAFGGGQVRASALGQHCRQGFGAGRWGFVWGRRPVPVLGGRAHSFPASLLLRRTTGRTVLLPRARVLPAMMITVRGWGQVFRFGCFHHVYFDIQIIGTAHWTFGFRAYNDKFDLYIQTWFIFYILFYI